MQTGGIGGTLFYQCVICSKYFDSSQGLAGHSKGHLGHGWKKGTSHRKVFLPYNPIYLQQQRQQQQQQQQQGCGSVAVSTDSSPLPINVAPQLPIIMQPQQAGGGGGGGGSVASRESNVVAKPKAKADRPQNVASSSSRVGPPHRKKHYLRFRDMKILARLTPRLAKEEQEIILRLVDCAMEQAKQEKMKNIDVEVIQNKDSAAADGVGTSTKKDVVTVEDSGDESKTM